MADLASGDWMATLREDPEIRRLARSIGLSDRFRFYLLVVETPRVARAVFDVLEEDVAADRAEPVHVQRLDPYQAHTDLDAPVPLDLLVEEVLAPLVTPSRAVASPRAIVVADASRAPPRDDGAWTDLFHRMNERRNVIAGALRGALVLALPPRLEPVFAQSAPDFWSIRTMAALVKAPPPQRPPASFAALEARRSRDEAPDEEDERSAEEIGRELAAARARLSAAPGDASALASLIVWLDRSVTHELSHGTLDAALASAEEGVALGRRRLKEDPERAEWLRELARSLKGLGDVQVERGELDRALASYIIPF